MLEAHFSSLPIQSSIYGMTSLGKHTVLVASSKRKVYLVDCGKNAEEHLSVSMKEVGFTYIPAGAEIISIDALYHSSYGYIVGITLIKCDSGGKQTQHFNMYSTWESSSECDLDAIARGCFILKLDFIPFHLTHTTVTEKESTEIVWLISGSDNKVHVYKEDECHQIYAEDENVDYYFPEFKDVNSVILWMDFISNPDSRITAYGCKNGEVVVAVISFLPDVRISSLWSIEHDGPIPFVRLYHEISSEINSSNKDESDFQAVIDSPLHLVVGNSLEVSVVYRDVLKKGLSLGGQWLLPNSGKYDCVMCCCIADINMDGENELLIGTYGQELLAYKWVPDGQDNKGVYSLFYQQSFSSPLLAIAYVDVIRDGLKELLVLSIKGLHVFQHNLQRAKEVCIQRLKEMVHFKYLESNEEPP